MSDKTTSAFHDAKSTAEGVLKDVVQTAEADDRDVMSELEELICDALGGTGWCIVPESEVDGG